MAEMLASLGNISKWPQNFIRNVTNTFDQLTLKTTMRLVIIVGAYAFIRPYIMKLGAKVQAAEHEKEIDFQESKPKLTANMLRDAGGKKVSFEDSDEEDGEVKDGEATGADWGKKARKRQRQFVKRAVEEQERLRLEQEGEQDDKDIMELLVDYEEGKDGW